MVVSPEVGRTGAEASFVVAVEDVMLLVVAVVVAVIEVLVDSVDELVDSVDEELLLLGVTVAVAPCVPTNNNPRC